MNLPVIVSWATYAQVTQWIGRAEISNQSIRHSQIEGKAIFHLWWNRKKGSTTIHEMKLWERFTLHFPVHISFTFGTSCWVVKPRNAHPSINFGYWVSNFAFHTPLLLLLVIRRIFHCPAPMGASNRIRSRFLFSPLTWPTQEGRIGKRQRWSLRID